MGTGAVYCQFSIEFMVFVFLHSVIFETLHQLCLFDIN